MTPFIFLAYFYLLSPPPPGTTFLSIPVTNMDAFFSPAHAFRDLTGLSLSFRTLFMILGAIHGAEGLYTLSLCRRYAKGAVVTVSLSHLSSSLALYPYVQAVYVGATVLFGIHIWKDLKRRVQESRIEAITKFE
jgi:hypothetical protein